MKVKTRFPEWAYFSQFILFTQFLSRSCQLRNMAPRGRELDYNEVRQYWFVNLSDLSPIIFCPFNKLTNSLFHSMLVDFSFDLTDLTLDFEGANSKLLDVVVLLMLILSVDNRLVRILKLKFGRGFEPEYLSRYWSWILMLLKSSVCWCNSTLGSVMPLAMFFIRAWQKCKDFYTENMRWIDWWRYWIMG